MLNAYPKKMQPTISSPYFNLCRKRNHTSLHSQVYLKGIFFFMPWHVAYPHISRIMGEGWHFIILSRHYLFQMPFWMEELRSISFIFYATRCINIIKWRINFRTTIILLLSLNLLVKFLNIILIENNFSIISFYSLEDNRSVIIYKSN